MLISFKTKPSVQGNSMCLYRLQHDLFVVIFGRNTTYKSCCYLFILQKFCNFHMQVFQIKLKYHCSKPIKLQKFLMQQYNKVIFSNNACIASSTMEPHDMYLGHCRKWLQALQSNKAVSKITRGTFRQVPTRPIRLSFVKCAYSDLRDIFLFHNFRGLKWIPLSEKDGTQLQNNNFGTSYLQAFTF